MSGYNYMQGLTGSGLMDNSYGAGSLSSPTVNYGGSPAGNFSSGAAYGDRPTQGPGAAGGPPSDLFTSLGGYSTNPDTHQTTLSSSVPKGSTFAPWFGYVSGNDFTNGSLNSSALSDPRLQGLQNFQYNALNQAAGSPYNIGDAYKNNQNAKYDYLHYGFMPGNQNYLGQYAQIGGNYYTPDQYQGLVDQYNAHIDAYNQNPTTTNWAGGGGSTITGTLLAPDKANTIDDFFGNSSIYKANPDRYFNSILNNNPDAAYHGIAISNSSRVPQVR